MVARSAAARIGQGVVWLVILGALGAIVGAVAIPRLAGAEPYTVLTGSMRPDLQPGSLVVVKPVPVDEIGIGDVITYQLESGARAVVTHRVVAVGSNGKGERTFQTQGDANDAPDEAWVRPVQVKGEVWYAVPYLGRVSDLFNGQQRMVAVYGTAALLLGYAAFMFTGAARDRRRPRHSAAPEEKAKEASRG